MKLMVGFIVCALALIGCKMSESEVRQKAGDAAVGAKRLVDTAGAEAKRAFDTAAQATKETMNDAGKRLDDVMLKGKILAGFKLVNGLDASNVNVDVKEGKVFLTGTVHTELDRMRVLGVAFGVTGSLERVDSKVEVKA